MSALTPTVEDVQSGQLTQKDRDMRANPKMRLQLYDGQHRAAASADLADFAQPAELQQTTRTCTQALAGRVPTTVTIRVI